MDQEFRAALSSFFLPCQKPGCGLPMTIVVRPGRLGIAEKKTVCICCDLTDARGACSHRKAAALSEAT